MQVYRIPFSTNVERIALACGHKSLQVDWVDVPADDRSAVVEVSGQPLVPVLVAGGEVVTDSPAILRWLERHAPRPPLWPLEPSRRAEADIFVDWFNRVWKRAPNLIAEELATSEPDMDAIGAWAAELAGSLERFEALLDGRDFLLSDTFGIADVIAFPFLKYRALWREDDDELFHLVLRDHLRPGTYPLLDAWTQRVDRLPRA